MPGSFASARLSLGTSPPSASTAAGGAGTTDGESVQTPAPPTGGSSTTGPAPNCEARILSRSSRALARYRSNGRLDPTFGRTEDNQNREPPEKDSRLDQACSGCSGARGRAKSHTRAGPGRDDLAIGPNRDRGCAQPTVRNEPRSPASRSIERLSTYNLMSR